MILSFREVFKEPFKCTKKYFVVSESLWTFQLRNLIATFFRATQGFFSNWVWTCRHMSCGELSSAGPKSYPVNLSILFLLPSSLCLLCLCMWERPVECGWCLPAVASPLTLISFSIAHLDPSSGEIADWWVCPATEAIGKTWPSPKEHEGWKTPSGPCNLNTINLSFFI